MKGEKPKYRPAVGSRLEDLCAPIAPCVDMGFRSPQLSDYLQAVGQSTQAAMQGLRTVSGSAGVVHQNINSWARATNSGPSRAAVGDMYTTHSGQVFQWNGHQWSRIKPAQPTKYPWSPQPDYNDLTRAMLDDPWRD